MRHTVLAAALALACGAAPVEARLSPQSAQTWEVERGTTAFLVEDHRAPLVEIRLMFPIGRWSPWAQRAGRIDQAFAQSPYLMRGVQFP